MKTNFKLELAPSGRELNLLISLISAGSTPQQSVRMIENLTEIPDFDWNTFLQLVKHHRVYPTIYTRFKSLDPALIPAIVMQTLYRDYIKNTFIMLHLCAENETVSEAMHNGNVQMITLKGPHLAKDLYGDVSLRTSKDLDILVPMRQIEEAEKILSKLGYVKQPLPFVFNDWKWRFHHFTYNHPQKRIQIELHWRLFPDTGMEPSFEEMWSRRRNYGNAGNPVFLLGLEDLFFYLVTHGARHGWFRLRWLADIDRLLVNSLRTRELIPLLDSFYALAMGGQAIILTSELFGTRIPPELSVLTANHDSRRLAKHAIHFIQTAAQPNDTMYYRHYLFLLKTFGQKWKYCVSLLFQRTIDAETLPLPKNLHFLYFPLRPFIWYWRKRK